MRELFNWRIYMAYEGEVTLPVKNPETGETADKTYKLKDITPSLHDVDTTPTPGSHNVVESGGVYEMIKESQANVPVNPSEIPKNEGAIWITT